MQGFEIIWLVGELRVSGVIIKFFMGFGSYRKFQKLINIHVRRFSCSSYMCSHIPSKTPYSCKTNTSAYVKPVFH